METTSHVHITTHKSLSFATSTPRTAGEEATRLRSETKLFSVRRLPSLFKGKKVSRRLSFSSSPSRISENSKIDSPKINPIQGAATKLISAGLNFFKGLNSNFAESSTMSCGAASTIGRRPYMEDRHFCDLSFLNDSSLFGVFDGHGGDSAAEYCIQNLPSYLTTLENTISQYPEEALHLAFEKLDQDFANLALSKSCDDGTTAVVAYIKDNVVWCANAGDSRCVLSRAGVAVELSEDHKPNLERERLRVVSIGGFIKYLGVWRIQGVLAVSRSIGDYTLKPYVIATPDVTKTELTEQDEFLILASDGLWDVLKSQEAIDFLHARPTLLRKPEHAARALVVEAFRRGSQDNITVVVVNLNIKQNSMFRVGSQTGKMDAVLEETVRT
eukprot:c17596_g1_i2.p1 GENE.c17596_g1_i2~~c17596_g1_i2.p1  ORF type:complete len:386 (+),score=151.22 c17596_g1_i2:119-1276(+)